MGRVMQTEEAHVSSLKFFQSVDQSSLRSNAW